MLAQERLEQLKRQKTLYSTEELDQRGWQRYAEICTDLEAQHYGEFVMIEVDSGDYFVGATSLGALQNAEVVHHDYGHLGGHQYRFWWDGMSGRTVSGADSLNVSVH